MRYSEIDPGRAARELYDALVSRIDQDQQDIPWPQRRHSLSMADIHPHKIRFRAEKHAVEFLMSREAEKLVASHGWSFVRRRPYEELIGGKQMPVMEVRLESNEGERPRTKPAELYHVTPQENLASIKAAGLEPRRASRPDMHEYSPRIHFATNLAAAQRMVAMFRKYDARQQVERDYAILRVDPTAVSDLRIDQEFHRDGVYTTGPVPPSAIELVSSI